MLPYDVALPLFTIVWTMTWTDTLAQYNFDLRLVSGEDNYGRLEIFYNGAWGTICDDNFGLSETKVACRQLGLSTSPVNHYSHKFGEGLGEIVLDQVSCSGEETSLQSCSHNPFYDNDCTHAEDVGISCGIDLNSSGSSSTFSGTGSWIGFVIAVVFVFVAISVYRRRRIMRLRQQQQTTTIFQAPSTAVVHVPNAAATGNANMPTYHHTTQPPANANVPAPSYSAVTQPYPPGQQPYPPAGVPSAGGPSPYPVQPFYPAVAQAGTAYPPATGTGTTVAAVAPYPPSAPQPSEAATAAYPPQSTAVYPPQSTAAYPPPAAAEGRVPTMYPPGESSAPPMDLPPPPSYDDIVKQK